MVQSYRAARSQCLMRPDVPALLVIESTQEPTTLASRITCNNTLGEIHGSLCDF
jgi:hypothetical protein